MCSYASSNTVGLGGTPCVMMTAVIGLGVQHV
jgi:hypothetical protein